MEDKRKIMTCEKCGGLYYENCRCPGCCDTIKKRWVGGQHTEKPPIKTTPIFKG